MVARDIFSTYLDGLTPSTEYDVRVRGENAVGRSDPSATLQTKTDGELIERLLPDVCVECDKSFPGAYTDSKNSSSYRRNCCVQKRVVNKASPFLA